MDNVTVNLDPVRIRFIVVTVPDLSAAEDEEFTPPADVERAKSEVRSALNRWYYGQPG